MGSVHLKRRTPMTFTCGRFSFALSRPLIMGILNVTPDSFSDGGRYVDHAAAVAHAHALVDAGADIIDIGGESTRPLAQAISQQEEMDRVLPVLEQLSTLDIALSLDTRHAAVMREGLARQVDLINDVSALSDPASLALLADSRAGVCLMHKQGDPHTMQHRPHYQDVVSEVHAYLTQRLEIALEAGIARERILIDPGFGFGKTVAHNFALLAQLPRFATLAPVLVGLSRKSMLAAVTGAPNPRVAGLPASVTAAVLAAQRGAAVVRVHDVAETRQALQVWAAVEAACHEESQ